MVLLERVVHIEESEVIAVNMREPKEEIIRGFIDQPTNRECRLYKRVLVEYDV